MCASQKPADEQRGSGYCVSAGTVETTSFTADTATTSVDIQTSVSSSVQDSTTAGDLVPTTSADQNVTTAVPSAATTASGNNTVAPSQPATPGDQVGYSRIQTLLKNYHGLWAMR